MLEKILVTSDLSATSNSVLPYALTLGQAFNSKLYLLHVMDPADMHQPEKLEAFPRLSPFLKSECTLPGLPRLHREIPVGKIYRYHRDPEAYILDFAAKKSIDLVCIAATTNGHRLAWWSAGAMTESLIKRAPCSIFCLRGRAMRPAQWKRPQFKNILLLLDLHDSNAVPLMKTLPLVQTFNSLLHVFPILTSRRLTSHHPLRELTAMNGDRTNVLLFADPQRSLRNLLQFVRKTEIDLIVIPANLRPRVSGWLMNDVLVQLMKISESPVLMLR